MIPTAMAAIAAFAPPGLKARFTAHPSGYFCLTWFLLRDWSQPLQVGVHPRPVGDCTGGQLLSDPDGRTDGAATALSSFGQGRAYTVACVEPLLTGFIPDVTRGFTLIFGIFMLASVIVLGGGSFVTRQVYVEDQAGK